MEISDPHPENFVDVLTQGLATRFGGSSLDFSVATFSPSTRAIFFPNWVARESAIGRSPLKFDGFYFHFSNWIEEGEKGRGFFRCKAWIRLRNWPILCWNSEDVKAAVSGFGELWEVDEASEQCTNLSFFRVNVRCQNVDIIPETLELMVEDKRFVIPIEIESSEDCNPILLGEHLDQRLGLDSLEEQERFIRQTGFTSIPAFGEQRTEGRRQTSLGRRSKGGRRRPATDAVLRRMHWRPIKNAFSNSICDISQYESRRARPGLVRRGRAGRGGVSTCDLPTSHKPRHEMMLSHGGSASVPLEDALVAGEGPLRDTVDVDRAHHAASHPVVGSGIRGEAHGGAPLMPGPPPFFAGPLPLTSNLLPAGPPLTVAGPPPSIGPSTASAGMEPVPPLGADPGLKLPSEPGGISDVRLVRAGPSAVLAGASGSSVPLLKPVLGPCDSLPLRLSERKDLSLISHPGFSSGISHFIEPPLDRDQCLGFLPGPLSLPRSNAGKLLNYRRSLRLAAKNKGSKKTFLQKAQALMCKKVKMANLASKISRTAATLPSSSSSSSAEPPLRSYPLGGSRRPPPSRRQGQSVSLLVKRTTRFPSLQKRFCLSRLSAGCPTQAPPMQLVVSGPRPRMLALQAAMLGRS